MSCAMDYNSSTAMDILANIQPRWKKLSNKYKNITMNTIFASKHRRSFQMHHIRRIFIAALIILLFCSLSSSALAHSGKTDARGGHYNRSTGEYHYHHGYSAHDHWDMDDDGDLDCPYDFDDATNHSRGESSGKVYTSNISDNSSSDTKQTERNTVPSYAYWIIGILVFIIFVMYFVIQSKNETIDSNERSHRLKELDTKKGISALHKDLTEKFGADYLYAISGAPSGDYVDEKSLPHSSTALTNKFSDEYTFYLGGPWNNSETKYHHSSCRYARSALPINIIQIKNSRRYRSCALCYRKLPDTAWVEKYNAHYSFLKQYIDQQEQNL